MSQQELLIQVVDVLQALDIQYLITGSWASTLEVDSIWTRIQNEANI